MRNRNFRMNRVLAAATALAVSGMYGTARAGITLDGTLDATYGSPLAVQTNNTGFGDANGSGNGSELDAAYGTIQNGDLYLFLAGNLEFGGNYNHLNIFIADGRAGQSTLATGGSLGAMNGTKFSPGFLATYALDINGDGGSTYFNANDLIANSSQYIGNIAPNSGTSGTLTNGIMAAFNNTNAAGVSGDVTSAADTTAAMAVSTGMELAIPLSLLGSPVGPISVVADINGGNNGYLSNQFLPTLANSGVSSVGNPGGSTFDFSATSGQYFTVPAATGGTSINGYYNYSAGGSYNTASHWNNSSVPQNPGDRATFGSSITAPATITLNGNISLGQITFNSPISYTIAPGTPAGTLTIDDTGDIAGVNPMITVAAGSHSISAPVALANGVTLSAASGTSLTLSGVLSGPGSITKSGLGTVALSGTNIFQSTSLAINNGTLELDNAAAAAGANIYIGDGTADNLPAYLNVGVAGLVIPNLIVTNQDDAGGNNYRYITGSYASGTSTFTGNLYLDGAVVFGVPTGAGLVYSGPIANGAGTTVQEKNDLIVGSALNVPTGSVTLSGINTYTGLTVVNAGKLIIPAGASIASPNVLVNAGGTLVVGGAVSTSTNLTVFGLATFNASTGTGISPLTVASVNIGSGGVVALAPAAVHANRTLLETPSLTFAGSTGAWAGQLDLSNNDMDVVGGSLAQITSQIAQGYNLTGGANFAGQGIVSSAAAANTRHLTTLGVISNTSNTGNAIYTAANPFDGTTPGTSDILVKYTYFGDANLDGKIDGSDYTLIDAGYASQQPGFTGTVLSGWYNGDFNYDGVIDGSDYALLDNAYHNQTVNLSTAALVATETAQVAGPAAAVPEPTGLAGAVLAGLAILRKRRR